MTASATPEAHASGTDAAGKKPVRPGIDWYFETELPLDHPDRARRLLREHPEVKELFGNNPWTVAILLPVVALQVGLAFALRESPWYLIVAVAWLVGAYANHCLWVVVHECAHQLIFKRKWMNALCAIVANFPFVVPAAVSFCIYHLKHHKYSGDPDHDADLARPWEASLIGRGVIGKLIWETLFPIFQSVRTLWLTSAGQSRFWKRWLVANIIVQVAFDVAIVWFFGPWALLYLGLSLIFSVGPHPLGARWIQEHFVVKEGQETYSYYGPLNVPALNVGMHVEHHDLPQVAWNRLPRLRRIAPQMYESLVYHRSWTWLWLRFLFDRNLTLYSRITRHGRAGYELPTNVNDKNFAVVEDPQVASAASAASAAPAAPATSSEAVATA
ncbi:MAG: fatty acid desaturase [Planctomycetota bacterium]